MNAIAARALRLITGDGNLTLGELETHLDLCARQFEIARTERARFMLSREMAELRRMIDAKGAVA
ncbi:MAG: hypothetical protein ACRCV9_21040 [Burkholderiaceae bacterium]